MAQQAFLVNPRGRKRARRKTTAARKTSRRRKTTTKRKGVPAWVRNRGFSSWASYMASIRPNKKGGTVKRRRRKRASVARVVRRRRRRSVARASAPRRRRYRRNPPLSRALNPKNLIGMATQGATAAVGVMAGKAGVRVGRSALKIAGGTPVGYAAEIAIGIAGAMLLQGVNRNLATNFLTGAFVSVGESVVKGMNLPIVSAALGDEGEGTLNLIGDEDDLSLRLSNGGGQGTYDMGSYELKEA